MLKTLVEDLVPLHHAQHFMLLYIWFVYVDFPLQFSSASAMLSNSSLLWKWHLTAYKHTNLNCTMLKQWYLRFNFFLLTIFLTVCLEQWAHDLTSWQVFLIWDSFHFFFVIFLYFRFVQVNCHLSLSLLLFFIRKMCFFVVVFKKRLTKCYN